MDAKEKNDARTEEGHKSKPVSMAQWKKPPTNHHLTVFSSRCSVSSKCTGMVQFPDGTRQQSVGRSAGSTLQVAEQKQHREEVASDTDYKGVGGVMGHVGQQEQRQTQQGSIGKETQTSRTEHSSADPLQQRHCISLHKRQMMSEDKNENSFRL